MMTALYTISETAEILKTNRDYVYKLCKCGLLPCLKLGSYKVRAEALEEFLKDYEGFDLTNPEGVKKLYKEG